MSKRISEEERIVAFFEQSDLAAASAVFNIVKATMKRRLEGPHGALGTIGTTSAPPAKPKRKRRTKPEMEAARRAKATDFPGEEGAA